MNQEQVWHEFMALPPDGQQQVADFIASLRSRMAQSEREMPSTNLRDEPFIGIWQTRDDLLDSSAWVRNTREQEWVQRHD